MPIYSYRCKNCGDFTQTSKMREYLTHCPKCGEEVKKLISTNVNVHYRSEGFYKYDTRFDKK